MIKDNITINTDSEFSLDFYHLARAFYPVENVSVTHKQLLNENKLSLNFEVEDIIKTSFYEVVKTFISTENNSQEKQIKRFLKQALYKAFEAHTGKTLPWGCLTGIHPTYVARELIADGVDISIVKEVLQKEFFLNEKKAELVYQTLKNQRTIIKNDHLVNLYINIPICPSRCSYCSFISSEISACGKILPDYLNALIEEIKATKKLIFDKALVVRTIYIGGGTPSVLTAQQLDLLLQELSYPVLEFTVECGRADTITEEKLLVLKKHGVTRICINPQTFVLKTLKKIGRTHTNQDVFNAYMLALKHNFVVNMDFIAGLEDETLSNFKKTINTALELSPTNITVHTLSLKNNSNLQGEFSLLKESGEVRQMIDYAYDKLTENGYKPYYLYRQKNQVEALENVGYAMDGKVCMFNIDTMEETLSVLACGAGAISKRVGGKKEKTERFQNPKFLKDYIANLNNVIEGKNKLFN